MHDRGGPHTPWDGNLLPEGANVEVRPLVDGKDILADVFTEGPGEDPQYLLLPNGPLTAATEPHEAGPAEGACTEGSAAPFT
ncbi:hypothetical protein GCM10022206_37770 [Streptomyces chiangmaiensis]